ncbi:hypothetical protein PAT3040_03772 [Paenibacillus agaridevorans]|uniref:DUF4184 domain-containing protein n=1 Tax=Paenibacillus agaridevorans TaxID=171404 RepID=A0A2R5ETZ6_9BACL|nr:DUF4184 family protein [Paenibacillus agaridevorans]GBG09139.1 hypothetical protein PAT3040_03772 [Paenibacillus agaridevorans]
MPFTFAHPLYAAPLKLVKPGWFSLTGLVLGSMSPDFEYFWAFEPRETIGHSLEGLYLFALPVSCVLALLFHYLIKEPLATCLPSRFGLDRRARNLIREREWRLRKLGDILKLLVSIAIGFFSHVFVDAFTHQSGFFVSRWGVLREELLGFPIYKLLQHGGSLLGLSVIILVMIATLKKASSDVPFEPSVSRGLKTGYWCVVFAVAILAIIVKWTYFGSTNQLGMFVVSSISGTLLGIIVASILFAPWIPPVRKVVKENLTS